MKVEFIDHDELDAIVADLACLAHEAAIMEAHNDVLLFVKILDKLLKGQIVEA